MQTKDLVEQGRKKLEVISETKKGMYLDHAAAIRQYTEWCNDNLPTILDRLEKRTKACEFYGDDSNWDGCDDTYTVADVEAWKDYGQLAREAMADEDIKDE